MAGSTGALTYKKTVDIATKDFLNLGIQGGLYMPKDLLFYDAVVNLWCLYNVDTQYIIMLEKSKNEIKRIKGRGDKWWE